MFMPPYQYFASFPEDNGGSIHVDHHSSHIRHHLITSSVFVLGDDGEVRKVFCVIAGCGQSVGAGAHEVVDHLVEGDVVGVT